MSGSENGGNSAEQRPVSSPRGPLGARSASPVKRSAAVMEEAGTGAQGLMEQTQLTAAGGPAPPQSDGQVDHDGAVNGTTLDVLHKMDTQEIVADNLAASIQGTNTANTSSTSLQSDELPPYSEHDTTEEDKWKKGSSKTSNKTLPSIDEQIKEVYEIINSSPIDEGCQGFLVSSKWLARVQSRSTDESIKPNFSSKEAREGPIGPIDNSDLVPEGAFASELQDASKRRFIPLKPGLVMGEDFVVLPEKALGLIHSWYTTSPDQRHAILRYAHNTTDSPAQNIIYEIYPPIITIRKVPHPSQQAERPPSPPSKSAEALRKRQEQKARGQSSPDDAVQLVSSRSERFQQFLKRAKEAAGIPIGTKVKLWRVLNRSNIAVDEPNSTEHSMLSPPQSRSNSPSKSAQTTVDKLVVTPAEFKDMEIGKDLEHIDAKDDTNNEKYNGKTAVDTYGIFENQTLLLEEQLGGPGGGEFQSDGKSSKPSLAAKKNSSKAGSAPASGRTSPTLTGMLTRGRARRDGRTRGTIGLSNLGNTCYMNSALQCIRSVEELALYFLSGKYKAEINTGNPLGHGGVMAKQYAGVLQGIYADNASSAFSPSEFKRTLGRLNPAFSGYGQQDSQEFLSFLVDALHEDLNRIIKKPYNENPDSDDSTVHDPQAIIDLGETYRSNHKARNDSVATDLFSGFYKNTMECPVCDKISITFDPYSLLTLQLPIESTFQHTVTFVPLNGPPINHEIDMDKNATVKTLKENIASKHPGVQASRLWMIEVYNHKIYKYFENQQSLAEASIGANDYIFVYELPNAPTNTPDPPPKKAFYTSYSSFSKSSISQVPDMESQKAERFAVPVFSRQKNRFANGWDIIMHPMYIMITREEAQNFDTILKKILIAVSRLTSRPMLMEMDEGQQQAAAETIASSETEKDESAGEESGRVSDRSVPSEDGLVDISIDGFARDPVTGGKNDLGAEPKQAVNAIPAGFMDPQYFISPALRNQLFEIKYFKSSEGLTCTGSPGMGERDIRSVFDRVKPPVRRESVQSSTSDESTTSTGSGPGNAESEESDADDDENHIRLGMEDSLHMQTPTSAEADSDDALPDDPLKAQRGGRRRQGGKKDKYQRKGNKGVVTYSRKDKLGGRRQQGRPGSSGSLRSTQSQRSLTGKPPQDDNPYYIKLAEGIILDWYPEGLDSLFGGEADTEDDMRGVFLSSAEGKHLNVMPDPILEAKREKRATRKKHGITLEDCFVETGKREILSEENEWYCNRCKEKRQAAKTLEIWTIPDILIVHLKRFGGNRSFRDKIDIMVDYPIEGLDLTEKIGLKENGKEYVYDLCAVDNHFGGLGGGHYTAIAKSFYDGQWYDYNDTSCTKAGEAKLHSAAAYLLFYRRRSDKPLGPQYLQDIVNEARNPPRPESVGEDADEFESGEGKLGGPTSSLHGSPSALVAAGADTNASLRNIANGGVAGADSIPTTKASPTSEGEDDSGPLGTLNGRPIIGPQRPQHLQYGSQGTADWGFDAIVQQPAEADDGATDRLLGNIGDVDFGEGDDDDDDDGSMVAENDSGYEPGGETREERMQELADTDVDVEYGTRGSEAWESIVNTPVDAMSLDFHDGREDEDGYSSARQQQDANFGAMHLENQELVDAESPPAVEIHMDGEVDDGAHGPMD